MRLVQLALRDFKAFRKANLRLAPLTVLIGPNNSGKSTLLHAVALLSQSVPASSRIVPNTRLDLGADLGRLTSIGADRAAGWSIHLSWVDEVPADDPISRGTPIGINFEVTVAGGASPTSRAWVEIMAPAPRLVTVAVTSGSNEMIIQGLEYRAERIQMPAFRDVVQVGNSPDLFRFPMPGLDPTARYAPEQLMDPNNRATRDYPLSMAAPYLQNRVAQALANYQYVGPSRQFTRSQLGLNAAQVPEAIGSPEDVAAAMAYDRELERRVSARCRTIFDYGVEIQNVPNGLVEVNALDRRDRPVTAVNMGSGFNQVAWMAAVLESRLLNQENQPDIPALVGLEEPELHLHPAAQGKVAEVLRTYATAGAQILCTTHSEHLLKAFLRQVLKGDLAPDQIGVAFVEDGKVEALPIDEMGRLKGGLRGFFETNEQELEEHLDLLVDKTKPDNPTVG